MSSLSFYHPVTHTQAQAGILIKVSGNVDKRENKSILIQRWMPRDNLLWYVSFSLLLLSIYVLLVLVNLSSFLQVKQPSTFLPKGIKHRPSFLSPPLFLSFSCALWVFFIYETSDFKTDFPPQVNTGAQSNATLCIWVCPCWRPSGGIPRRPRQSAPWPPSLWLTPTPLTKGENPHHMRSGPTHNKHTLPTPAGCLAVWGNTR